MFSISALIACAYFLKMAGNNKSRLEQTLRQKQNKTIVVSTFLAIIRRFNSTK